MNLELTKEQFKSLLELVFMGNWVANALRTEDLIDKYDDLQRELFSKTPEFGVGEWVEPNGNLTDDFLDRVFPLIDEFTGMSFWEELVEMLARGDVMKRHNAKTWDSIPGERKFEELEEFKSKYLSIFEKQGLDALSLKGQLNL